MMQQQSNAQPVYFCSVFSNFNKKAAYALGLAQLIIGGALITFNAIAIRFTRHDHPDDFEFYSIVAYGIWGGGLMVIAGILQVLAAQKPWKCLVITFVVMTVMSFCSAIVVIVLGIITADEKGDFLITCYRGDTRSTTARVELCDDRQTRIQISMNALMVIAAFVELAVSIYSIVIACQACCSFEDYNVQSPNMTMHEGNVSAYSTTALVPGQLEAAHKAEEGQSKEL